MKRSILSICILLASVSLVFANIYKKYDVRSGLSGNCVRSILQDSIGYMWFATQDGLNRFNGIEFTNYGHSSENGGNSYMNIVTICRHQDNNQIWVASTEKLYLFDSWEEKFSVFDKQTEDGHQSTASSEWHTTMTGSYGSEQPTGCLSTTRKKVR